MVNFKNYSKIVKILAEQTTSSGYTLSQDEKDKIKQAWDNRNNPIARGFIEDAWNKSSDDKKRAAIEYAESQGWDFSEMKLQSPPPTSTQNTQSMPTQTTPSPTSGSSDQLLKTISRTKKFINVTNSKSDDIKNDLKNNPSGPNGKIYFSKAKEILTALVSDLKQAPQNYIDINGPVIAEDINNFRKTLLSINPTFYKSEFEKTFDTIYDSNSNNLIKPSEATDTNNKTIETNRTEEEVKADLDAAIKAKDQKKASELFDELAVVRKKKDSSYEPTDLLKKYPAAGDAAKSPDMPKAATNASKGGYATGYTGVSIIDFLDQSGKPSDKESRRKLAVELGIVNKPEEYKGTADQNTRLLNALRGGKVTSDDGVEVRKAELAKPYTKPKDGKGPTIKYGRMEYPAYVDMGGGKYRPAYQEELDNPNIQLYIPNPKKGAQEYNKPNYVKVRREGSNIRPQSQFGGALGSVSNLFGDIGNTLAGKK